MSTYMNRTTPGVYLTEFSAFPKSIPGVATAIPAFIGYTEKCDVSGKQALFTPFLINSLADYVAIFGDEFNAVYDMADKDKDGKAYDAENSDFSSQVCECHHQCLRYHLLCLHPVEHDVPTPVRTEPAEPSRRR